VGAAARKGLAEKGHRLFFSWIAHNPLKSPESDEEIQGNPSRFFLVFLGFRWFRLEEFGRGVTLGEPV